MKITAFRLAAAVLFAAVSVSAHAATYICEVDGQVQFTTQKLNSSCRPSHTDGTAQVSADEAAKAVPEQVGLKEAPGAAAPEVSDIKILPKIKQGSVTNTAEAANPKLNIKLRKGDMPAAGTSAADLKSAKARADELNRKAKIIPAPIIAAPAAKPKQQLTRKQILQNEIRNEQTALVRAKAQLNVAKQKGDQQKIARLTQAVSDREANIRAIQGEIRR
ncbi:hypothetical protein L4G92_00880 [Neisseria sp. ZJ106]|uniref:Periplasmic protein n=1 Tax=Neisseria lisongii TaxID=2912188 RepID=A0ABY7RJ99_9NEIS|nr:hypothetical protein [Neisseria lisongii]MCF7520609.1 hypothetical protein [Neisseria lisongii]WCL71457.1 hypothetical protein PJU73_09045 [Neisseria lisongii]